MRDAPIDGLIQKILSAHPGKNPGHCADENRMAAYLEASLSPKEAADFEAHVSTCDSCQEILALAMKLQAASGERRVKQPADSKRILFRFSIPVPVLGALAIAVVLGAIFLRIPHKSGQKPDDQQIAELRRSVLGTQETELKSVEPKPDKSSYVSAKSARTESSAVPHEKSRGDSAPVQMFSMPKNEQASLPADLRADLPAPSIPAPIPAGNSIQALQDANEGRKPQDEKASPTVAAKTGSLDSAQRDAVGAVPSAISAGNLAQRSTATVDAEQLLQSAPPAGPVVGMGQAQQTGTAESQQAEKAKNAGVDEAASIRVQEAVARPRLYAVQNRIAITHYTNPSVADSLRLALKDLDSPNQKRAESRKIGDRVFYRKSGYWIEKECVKHPDAVMVEITSGAPEYAPILKEYPGIGTLAPALVYRKDRLYLVR